MKCLSLADTPFDLKQSLHSGQVFHWSAEGAGFIGTVGDAAVYLEQNGEKLLFQGVSEKVVRSYLGLNDPLNRILASFPKNDASLQAATAYTPGLRILRQPKWECLATFITSSMKQMTHIRQISLTLRMRYGEERAIAKQRVYTYPSPERLADAGEEALRACSLGYRAKSLTLAAQAVAAGECDLEAIDSLSDANALECLCQLHGVGEKIAHCVLLFAYGRHAAFPIDVWVERIITRLYPPPNAKTPKATQPAWNRREMQAFAAQHFGPYAGYAQQYLFHYARHADKAFFTSGDA